MKTSKKVFLSVLMGAICVLGVVVWAEANSTTMFAPADLRDAKKTIKAATEGAGRTATNEEREIIRLFEREVEMVQTTNVTAKFCGVAIVIFAILCTFAIWVPSEPEKLNQSPEATPGQRPPPTPSSSSGAPQL
jgi:hypothetical protein